MKQGREWFSIGLEALPALRPKEKQLFLEELGISTVAGLLSYYPLRYEDRRFVKDMAHVTGREPEVQVCGELVSLNVMQGKRRYLEAFFHDGSGRVRAMWFRAIEWHYKQLKLHSRYLLFGSPKSFRGVVSIMHPEYSLYTEKAKALFTINPIYETTQAMKKAYCDTRRVAHLMRQAVEHFVARAWDPLPESVQRSYLFPPRAWALAHIHFPKNEKDIVQARARLAFEELFLFQINIQRTRGEVQQRYGGLRFDTVGDLFNGYYHHHLRFSLTEAQKRVLREIRQDTLSGYQMNRLLQGDVGSGKTLVALFSMLLALDNGYQACFMAPTEILAQQHFRKIEQALSPLGVRVGLLTGSTRASERNVLNALLEEDRLQVIIGTHALLEDWVQFRRLGLVVIDEQHRFGVNQRARLWAKGPEGFVPHVLIMTATPIPRTLALTLYGDLDVSVIDELPPGRKPIETRHVYRQHAHLYYRLMRQELEAGRQVYVVYPLIEESEKQDMESLESGYLVLRDMFPPSSYRMGLLHGRMGAAEKECVMQEFQQGRTQILVSTTVIEVGVDVPNASVMVIMSANRFGLSQLHQLRGRVGRGAERSYCVLVTEYKLSATARKRIETMVETQDGFAIAEVDMKLRGAGDLAGTSQSGFVGLFRLASVQHDSRLIAAAQASAREVIAHDALLEKEENRTLREYIENMHQGEGINYRHIG